MLPKIFCPSPFGVYLVIKKKIKKKKFESHAEMVASIAILCLAVCHVMDKASMVVQNGSEHSHYLSVSLCLSCYEQGQHVHAKVSIMPGAKLFLLFTG